MDFTISPQVEQYRQQIRTFLDEHVIPLETNRDAYDDGENINDEYLLPLRQKARDAGLWCFQLPEAIGGKAVGHVGMAVLYEEMARSIFGPVCFNAAAPDDGNMMVLNKVASAEQKERFLMPIVRGESRSAFVMTEPAPGSGSDPGGMMRTTAEKKGDRWILNGDKWFITGAGIADVFIIIARTSNDARNGLSAFLYHRSDPGWEIVRRIPIMGPEEHGGHCELRFNNMEIPDSQRLMGVGDGLRLTQIRLGPARLTHCMRWLGMAKRALEIASEYVSEREAFGSTLADHEGVQWLLGEAAMEIHIGRLLTMNAAWQLDQGERARKEVSMAKVAVADTLHRSIDTAIQLCGAKGYSRDTLLEWMYRYARQARLVDGASEVHKMVLSRFLQKEGRQFWQWSEGPTV